MIGLYQYYRIVAAFLILLIHQSFWTVPQVLGRFTIVAVPIFASMAGFLFAKTLEGNFDIKKILEKKSRRVLIPYCVWAVIYWVANSVVLDGVIRHQPITFPGLRSWLLGGTACHLWFMPCLFALFGVFALIGWIARKSNVCFIWFSVIVLFLSALTQLISDETSATFAGYVRIYFGRCAFYFALGTVMQHFVVLKSINCIWGGIAILLGCMNVWFSFWGGLVWNPLLLVIGLMLVAQHYRDIKLNKRVTKLSDASMGIYLVHVLFTSGTNFALQRIGHSQLPSLMGCFLSIIIYALSFLMVRLLPKKFF